MTSPAMDSTDIPAGSRIPSAHASTQSRSPAARRPAWAGNWQMVINSRWAVLPSMASMSGFSLSHRPTCSGRPTVGCPAGLDTRSREGRSSTASLHCPSGVQKTVGVEPVNVDWASCLGPGVVGHHDLGRGFHRLVRVLGLRLPPYASDYRNRESLVRRQAAERHLEDGGIYRKRWWASLDSNQGPQSYQDCALTD